MNELEPQAPPSELPQAVHARRWHWSPWLIWLIPVVAALIGGSLLIQSLRSRGPTITIFFKNAEGLEAGKTRIKYKEVDIGTVRKIGLSDDHQKVVVTAQLVKNASGFLRDDTRFWVVRPRVGAGGISGLGTLLSGSYIGIDAGKSDKEREEFTGLDVPPFIVTGLSGRQFTLHADQIGSLDIGAPIFYRHIQVGQLAAYELNADGSGVIMHVFINAPYDRYVTTAARFWQSSGVEFSVDANGAKVTTESLAAIISGGISFAIPDDLPIAPVAQVNADFTLYSSRDIAMKHADTVLKKALVYFNESVRGLIIGAPVDFRGIVIGEVTGIKLDYDKKNGVYTFPIEINLYPQRLESHYRNGAASPVAADLPRILDKLVSNGLRAQLKTGNLLTGQLYVALDFFPEAPAFKIDWRNEPFVLATVPGRLEELQTIASRIARRLDKIPVDKIAEETRTALTSLTKAIKRTDKLVAHLDNDITPAARAALDQARKTLASAEAVLASDAPITQDLRGALRDVGQAAQSLRDLTDYLERHPESLIRGKKATP